MVQPKKYKNQSERQRAYLERKKQREELEHQTEVDQYKKQLEEIEYVNKKWEELKEHPDLGGEFQRMEANAAWENIPHNRFLELKKEKIAEAIKRGELTP